MQFPVCVTTDRKLCNMLIVKRLAKTRFIPSPAPLGPGSAYIWTRSTHLYQHDATSNADSPQNRVAHCKSCNEQRGNRPKPCYSLHAFPTLWRRFVVWMVLVCHMNGTGVPCRWCRSPLQLVQVGKCCTCRRRVLGIYAFCWRRPV